ncbi:GTPase IMAP family member 8 [Collichthys lucidus]|uniref:GTPase IMAP family member 8 n=1 Tax=Collichthys lucidus TaxID=240159 RepID=A0A4U5V856_COLLU|nr:GTPase IMAP family member 8 [Collichthys lucidus]TKS84104.1 GTPase IMAP family member 8 [Collichthys lucidus]
MINIILLGLTGTGKSASANTILTAGNPKIDPEQLFRSEASSMPITKQCEAKIIQKPFKRQLGRITDSEKEIIQKLENKLGWRIRESTTVLLTHGEDLKGSLEKHINACGALNNIVAMCNNRYHLFSNSTKDSKQVTELIKKIPHFKKKKKSLMSLVFDALQLED